ncbi:unnamed protein product [Didymodactylos carnosus]|uniref:Rad4 beta-hairpin domain-containing protein n=1 Tax=Didymodactylos carnosus TaxID=1234261 RepID=A0A8S2D6J9_9BILA|nr:unnamed protein product [Didymodactylos carnosus]CAF3640500.1 unnamed protein product [Didymodactylos carnosus]CAF4390055.1 unnamed protein product [Didymodactylos carnosus]
MEDQCLENQLLRPTSKASLKGHLLYALYSHLLKFESIYPNETPPVRYLDKDKEPIYPRDKVVTLCSKANMVKRSKNSNG